MLVAMLKLRISALLSKKGSFPWRSYSDDNSVSNDYAQPLMQATIWTNKQDVSVSLAAAAGGDALATQIRGEQNRHFRWGPRGRVCGVMAALVHFEWFLQLNTARMQVGNHHELMIGR